MSIHLFICQKIWLITEKKSCQEELISKKKGELKRQLSITATSRERKKPKATKPTRICAPLRRHKAGVARETLHHTATKEQ